MIGGEKKIRKKDTYFLLAIKKNKKDFVNKQLELFHVHRILYSFTLSP
jgi:hypothetical protein